MMTHVGLLTWVDDIDVSQVEAFEKELLTLPSLIPEIQSFKFARDAGLNKGNADFIIIAEFASQSDFEIYVDHPGHLALIEKLGHKMIKAYSGIQF